MKKKLLLFAIFITMCFGNLSAQTTMGPWNPVLYPEVVGTPGWEVQDNNATGSISDPFASWSQVVTAIESGGPNQTVTILPDAFIESFNYDNINGAESTLGHNLATELNITSTQNGLMINGSPEGCYTVFDNFANGSGSLFGTIDGADNITIKGMYLLNGYAGAFNITNSTNVVFEDCIFDNNDYNGVEVFNITSGGIGTSVTFTNCQFINNNHVGIVMNVNRGGSHMPIDLTFNSCVWSCNSATSGGTAMKVTNDATGGITMDFTDCTFANNTSTGSQGGAIWWDDSETTTTFTNTNFINNSISGGNGGGALFIGKDDNITMTACNFYGNSSTSSSADGGAISVTGGSSGKAILNLNTATFDNNSSGDDGGAIAMRHATVFLDNMHVLNNTAGDGIISTLNSGATCTASNITCGSNSAPDGCLYPKSGTITDNGGSASGSPIDLSISAPSYACGSYCATEVPATCTSVSRSSSICAASGSLNISGEVWEDINGNGIQEVGDNGINNAFVLLYDSNDNLIGRTNTDGTGAYAFVGLPAGNYYVVFTNPDTDAHPNVSPPNTGTESTDSDIINNTTNATASINSTSVDVDGAFTNIVLPVEFLSFRGEKLKKSIELNWETANELKNEGFIIERKSDNNWKKLGYVKSNENTNSDRAYYFIDNNPNLGENLYRLKQIDFDGQFAYSSVIIVDFSGRQPTLDFYPNPAQNQINLSFDALQTGAADLQIFDFAGREIYQSSLSLNSGFNQLNFDLSDWKSGVYFVRIFLQNGDQLTGKIIKN